MARFDAYLQGTPSWVELITPEPDAGKEFYAGLFGWQYDDRPIPGGDSVYSIVQIEGDDIGGLSGQMPGLEGHPAFWGVYLAVDDADASAAKAEAAGAKIEAGPFDVGTAGRMVAIQDPTGVRVGLWQAGETTGSQRANEPGTPIWNELVSPDLATATKFYADALGVSWEAMPMDDGEYTCLVVDGRQVGGAMPPMMEGVPPHWNVYFNVVSCDETLVQAQGLGAKVLAPAFDVPGVGRMAFLADPQGAMFALMQSPTEQG